MKRSSFSVGSALTSALVTVFSKLLGDYISQLCVIWYFLRVEHLIDRININMIFRIFSFVVATLLRRIAKIRLPYDLLICVYAIDLITLWSLSFIVKNSLVENFDVL